MISVPERHFPDLPTLADDYLHAYSRVREFFDGDFRDPAAFRRQAERVRTRGLPRETLAAVLIEQNKRFGCGPATIGRIERLVRDRACAVVTGQQAGLFSGPLYTIYKAFTAVKLAERLTRDGLGCFVPVFWIASEDHDAAEADHICLLDREHRPETVHCPLSAAGSKISVSEIQAPPEIADCIRRISELTVDTEFKAEVLGALAEDYQTGRLWAEAFARWMTRLFGPRGLIFIDGADPRLKEMGRAVFLREIACGSASTPPALDASRMLREAGYGGQIQLHEGILNLFYSEGGRRTIHRAGEDFEIKDPPRTFRGDELPSLAGEKPFLFSPNVLLRPVYQDALLPTVAYVGGPGEIAYFAQMKGVYEVFGMPMPVIFPRVSATIVESAVDHILKKFGLGVPDFWREAESLIGDMARERIPAALAGILDQARSRMEADFEGLTREIAAFEPTLMDSAALAKGKIDHQWKFLEKKILQAGTKRNETEVRQLRKSAAHLFPDRRPQERVFNIVPYLLKYGWTLMDVLDRAADVAETGHRIIRI